MESTMRTQRSFVASLCLAYEAQLVDYPHQMLGNRERAGEIAHESFAALDAAVLPEKLPFPRAALFQVATSFALMELRRRRLATAGVIDSAGLEEVPECRISPDRQANADQLADHLAKVIKALRPTYRNVFVMTHGKGMTRKEVSAALGISEKRVSYLMTKSLKICRERLSARGLDLADMVGVLVLLHFACALSIH